MMVKIKNDKMDTNNVGNGFVANDSTRLSVWTSELFSDEWRLLAMTNAFMESTSAHGFGHISHTKKKKGKLFWSLLVIGNILTQILFLIG